MKLIKPRQLVTNQRGKDSRGSESRWVVPDMVVSKEGHSEILDPTEERGSREVREAGTPKYQHTERNKKGLVRETKRRQMWLE